MELFIFYPSENLGKVAHVQSKLKIKCKPHLVYKKYQFVENQDIYKKKKLLS